MFIQKNRFNVVLKLKLIKLKLKKNILILFKNISAFLYKENFINYKVNLFFF